MREDNPLYSAEEVSSSRLHRSEALIKQAKDGSLWGNGMAQFALGSENYTGGITFEDRDGKITKYPSVEVMRIALEIRGVVQKVDQGD